MQEGWIRSKWRPAIGWAYVAIVVFDFLIAPILWTAAQGYVLSEVENGQTAVIAQQWEPLTLQGNGLFHIAMGAFLGVTSHGRTREKLQGVAGDGYLRLTPGDRK